ncbi:MAG: transcriptional coactivator p15/PC4 family protein, partial [Gemmatimonadales bacterium]
KNPREDIRVVFSKFKGHDLLGVRVWYRDANEELRPSKSGVTVRVDLLPDLLNLIEQAKKIAIEQGFLDAEDFELPAEA